MIITGAVYQEAVIEGKRRGHPDAFAIERAVADGRVHVIQSEGLHTAQLDHAAGLYARREVTLARAAEIAGVSIYEMMALTVHLILYPEETWYVAHCLEFDLVAQGKTLLDAFKNLLDAIDVQAAYAQEAGDWGQLFVPAPAW